MIIEKERKYLIENSDAILKEIESNIHIEITQVYLNDDCTLRARKSSYGGFHKAEINYKEYINETDRKEYEYLIYLSEFNKIISEKEYRYYLTKKRYKVNGFEVDVYPFGLVVAEYEYNDESDLPDRLPAWIIKDITGVEKYTNIYITKNWDELNKKKWES